MNRLFLLLFGAVTFVAHAQVPDYVPTEGLVAWYPFNGNANDESGNGYDGVVQGASLSENRFGIENQSFSFDGMDDYISVSNDFNFNELTVSVWIKQNQFAETYSAIIDRSLTNNIGWWIEDNAVSYDSLLFTGGVASGNYFRTQAARPQPNAWTHIGALYSSGNQQLFINGVLVDQDVNSLLLQFPEVTMFLGKRTNSAFWDGSIDDVGIWNRALTEDEILTLYNAEPPAPGCTDPTACNFDAEATSDDGSCIPSGCMDSEACNYNALAECEGEACEYSCCPGPGCCLEGTVWDAELGGCIPIEATCPEDLDFDGVVGVNDLMELLSAFGTDCAPAEEPEPTEFTCGDPVNYHGYDYATIQIGEQCWFAENLRSAFYANGDTIETNLSISQWSSTTEGAQVIYGDDAFGINGGNPNEESNFNDYGLLYNWFAASDARGLCPIGWHIPTDLDFIHLELELGMSEVAANSTGWRGHEQATALKSSPVDIPSWNGSNISGFGALPGGRLYPQGIFNLEGDGDGHCNFWDASNGGRVIHQSAGIYRGQDINPNFGYSVRCLKD